MLLIPENIGDRVFSVRKTKIPIEYREKDITRGGSRTPATSYYHKDPQLGCSSSPRSASDNVFQELNISNVLIFLTDCQSNTFLLMNIIISVIFI